MIDVKRILYPVYHKKENGRHLFCGKACLDWLKLVLYLLAFYAFITLFTAALWFSFKALVLDQDLQKKIPYRKAFKYANEKIGTNDTLYPLRKEVDRNCRNNLIFSSLLDFPFLTHVPRRNGGGIDDRENRLKRRQMYLEQLRTFRGRFERVEGGEQVDCNNSSNYQEDLKKDIFSRSCKEETTALDLCIQAWESQANLTQNPCLAVKLNNVVGFLPKLYPDQSKVEEQLHNAKKQKHSNYPAGSSELVAPPYDPYRVPIVCWHYIDGRLTNLFGSQAGDLIKLDPPGGISIKQFPYLNQKGFSQGYAIMTLNVNGTLKDVIKEEKITVECRAVAENIPYGYKVDANPVSKYGHFRMKFELDDDNGTRFFKLSV